MQSHRPSQPLLFQNCCGFPISAELVLRSFRRNRCNRFGLRACVQSHKDNCSNGSLGTNAKGPTPVRRPQVLNNVEIDLVDGFDRRYSTTVQGEPQWGNPLTFHDLSSRGKLVVAVDVDEGSYFPLPFLISFPGFSFLFLLLLHCNVSSSSSSSSSSSTSDICVYETFGAL